MSFWQALERPIIGLSPMDGVTDAAFRGIVAQYGPADVTFTEFTSVMDVCRGPDAVLSGFLYGERERPIVAQLYGKQPELFYQAAHIVCALGFDGIDLNMGCPSKNVASSGSGAGLIRTPDLAHAVFCATRDGMLDWAKGQTLEAAGIKAARIALIRHMNQQRSGREDVPRRVLPISIKTRIGYDSPIVDQWIGHLLRVEPAMISLHGRTLQQMYRGAADWTAIARAVVVAQGSKTGILGNGDVHSMEDALRRITETGVAGVLVGRGTLGSPWFFQTKAAVRGRVAGHAAPDLPLDVGAGCAERLAAMLRHAEYFEGLFGERRFPRMRKHLGWYCKGFAHAAAMRGSLVRASSAQDVRRVIDEYERRVLYSESPGSGTFTVPSFSCR